MNTRILLALVATTGALFALGCQNVDSRIKQKPEVFANLDAATQEKIRQGTIDIGYTEDMVYLALGAPDSKRDVRSASGLSTAWVYNTYFERYDGTRFMGYQRRVIFDPATNNYRVTFLPVYADAYRPEVEERIRVLFANGKVSVIEQAKN